MEIPFYHVDAFTEKVFAGNPAAVCPLQKWLEDGILQAIAAEFNLSETAFFVSEADGYRLRWFTPKVEVDLCGHATLASAHVIFHYLQPSLKLIRFYTLSGELQVRREAGHLSMDFPSRKPQPVSAPAQLIQGLGKAPQEVLKSRDYIAVFSAEEDIRSIRPDFQKLKALDSLGICISAPGRDCDFVSRFFAPRAGIDEDPVTGSSHSSLIPYWAERLGKKQLLARQLSERGGTLYCVDRGERVSIGGTAVIFARGTISI